MLSNKGLCFLLVSLFLIGLLAVAGCQAPTPEPTATPLPGPSPEVVETESNATGADADAVPSPDDQTVKVVFVMADSPTDRGWNAAHYRGIEALKTLGEVVDENKPVLHRQTRRRPFVERDGSRKGWLQRDGHRPGGALHVGAGPANGLRHLL